MNNHEHCESFLSRSPSSYACQDAQKRTRASLSQSDHSNKERNRLLTFLPSNIGQCCRQSRCRSDQRKTRNYARTVSLRDSAARQRGDVTFQLREGPEGFYEFCHLGERHEIGCLVQDINALYEEMLIDRTIPALSEWLSLHSEHYETNCATSEGRKNDQSWGTMCSIRVMIAVCIYVF